MKMKNLCFAPGSACLVGSAVLAISGQAAAAACPTGANTVYMSGGSTDIPVVQAVANLLGSAVNIVYQKPGACEGLLYVLGDTGTSVLPDADAALSLAPNGPSGGAACTLPTIAVGATTEPAARVDIAVSDVYVATCQGSFDPNLNSVGSSTMTKDYLGPVQAMTFAVASASTEQVISAEAAYMVFGFDATPAADAIAPWTVPGDIYVRFWDAAVLEMIATAINLPAGMWVNATNRSSLQAPGSAGTEATDLLAAAATNGATSTNATIGILGSSNYVAGLRPLAFQAVGQSCGYLPDSSSTAHDKLNVRQGRYAIWGPEHLVVNVDANGNLLGQNSNTASVQLVLNALVATSQAPAASSADGGLTDAEEGTIISAISLPAVGVVPWCAMQVTRTSEVGPEASYAPPAACSCAFEEASGAVVPGHTCTACTGTGAGVCTGATPACHFGYCEAE
jgi:hypothetical protein